MSTLLRTTTIFLPQARTRSRKARSLSVNGRSAEVAKSTRSARGTKRSVIASCRRSRALVPGVSTRVRCSSSGSGAVSSSMPSVEARREAVSPWRSRWMAVVVGVTPSSSTALPSRALISVLLPALNSPTTTSRKSSSSCRIDSTSAARSSAAASTRPSATCSSPSAARSSARSASWSWRSRRTGIPTILDGGGRLPLDGHRQESKPSATESEQQFPAVGKWTPVSV